MAVVAAAVTVAVAVVVVVVVESREQLAKTIATTTMHATASIDCKNEAKTNRAKYLVVDHVLCMSLASKFKGPQLHRYPH